MKLLGLLSRALAGAQERAPVLNCRLDPDRLRNAQRDAARAAFLSDQPRDRAKAVITFGDTQ